jgi:hypothetical protein
MCWGTRSGWRSVAGVQGRSVTDEAEDWLVADNTVMAVLFVVLGAKVLGDRLAIVA